MSQLRNILRGDFNFIHERNRLVKDVFPLLQTYCQRKGLEFQVLDMRWGVRDENISLHLTSDVCIQEILNCQRLSLGPSFVALLGDRYGYCPLPSSIPVEEYDLFLKISNAHRIQISLLTMWYMLDYNMNPPAYQLQPITTYYQHFTSTKPDLKRQHSESWMVTFEELRQLLRKLVEIAVAEESMSPKRAHTYFQSVTEDEINHGLLNIQFPNDHCLCYSRNLVGIKLSDHAAAKYTDLDLLDPNTVNAKAQMHLHQLKQEKIPAVLSSSNRRAYSIPWMPVGIDPSRIEHEVYLQNLCDHIFADVKTLIDKALSLRQLHCSPLDQEVLHHARFCRNKCSSFCGREDVLNQVYSFLRLQKQHPLVLYGPSGSGKTSIMAKCASSLQTWLNDLSIVIVVRFLGTSPASSSIRTVLESVCTQLCKVFSVPAPNFMESNYLDIVQFFTTQLFDTLELREDQHICIFLDAVDQLSSSDGAHTFNWLPKSLPSNVHIIASILPEEHRCLKTLQAILSNHDCYIEVLPMPSETGLELLNAWLKGSGRTISSQQRAVVLNAFLKCPQPLYLRLLFRTALQWKSYHAISESSLAGNIQDAISDFFQYLEAHYGMVVEKALGYLTAARHGLSELELEDILSLDDEVLDDVYQYWEPPVKGVVRLPPLLWKRIRYFISDYVVEQQADGKTVLAWYHRQFHQSALKRYLDQHSAKVQIHIILSTYFEGTFGGGKAKSIYLSHLNLTIKNVDRQLPEQPLRYSGEIYNMHKLSELPYHLVLSEQLEKLKSLSLCNFEWLYIKMKAMGFDSLMEDMALASRLSDLDIHVVSEALLLSAGSIKQNTAGLASSLLGRLQSEGQSPFLHQLLGNARVWAETVSENKVEIVPCNNCLIRPGGLLKTTLCGHPQVVHSIAVLYPLLISSSKGFECCIFNLWDITSIQYIQHLHTFKLPGQGNPIFVARREALFAVCSQQMTFWDLNSRVAVYNYAVPCEITSCAITNDANILLAGTKNGTLYCCNRKTNEFPIPSAVHGSSITCIEVSHDDRIAVMATESGALGIYELMSNTTIHTVSAHGGSITCLVITIFGNSPVILSGSTDKTARTWGLMDGKHICTFSGHSKAVKCVATLPTHIITGSLDSTIRLWDPSSGSCIRTLKGHLEDVWCIAFFPCRNKLVSGSKDDYLKVWDIEKGECLQTLEGHSSWVSCVAVEPSGLIISGSNDKTIKIWNYETSNQLTADRHFKQPECITSSSTLGLVVSGAPDSIKVWKLSNGQCVHTFSSSASCVVIIDKDGRLVSGTKDGTIAAWSLLTFESLNVQKVHSKGVTCLSQLGSEGAIISASADGVIKKWQAEFCEYGAFSGHTDGVKCIAISKDETLLASGSLDCTVRVWNVSNGVCIAVFSGHKKAVWCVAVSGDNTLVASGADDATVQIWSLVNFGPLHVIRHPDNVKCVLFSPDNNFIITGAHCSENQLSAWSTITGDRIVRYVGHTHAVMCILQMDTHHVITGSRDGTIRCWNLLSGGLLATFDLQSQVKHLTLSRVNNHTVLSCTTKTGPIAVLDVFVKT